MPNPLNVRLHAVIEGRVQGVGYRYFAQEQARKLGLTGWVRNRWNGTVEVTAEGRFTKVDEFARILQRGPQSAFVSEMKMDRTDVTGEFKSFEIRGTG